MRTILLSTALFAALAASTVSAQQPPQPQPPLRANERYCLESYDEQGPAGRLCRYETMEQCIASKTAHVDRCMLNPWLAFQQRNR